MHRMHGGKPHSLKYPRVSAEPLCKESPIVELSHRLSAKVEAIKDTCRGKPQCKEPQANVECLKSPTKEMAKTQNLIAPLFP